MFFLLGGNDKKGRKKEEQKPDRAMERVKEIFLTGKFPVVTTDKVEGRQIAKMLGLVCCRGYDSEEAFFGMAARAVNKGAHAIVGYCENVAFHPDGSKYFSCFGTAVMFEWEQDEKFGAAAIRQLRMGAVAGSLAADAEEDRVTLRKPESSLSSMHGRSVSQMLDSDSNLDSLENNLEVMQRQFRSQ